MSVPDKTFSSGYEKVNGLSDTECPYCASLCCSNWQKFGCCVPEDCRQYSQIIAVMAKAIWSEDEMADAGSWEDLLHQNDEALGNQQPYFDMALAAFLKARPLIEKIAYEALPK